MLSLKRGNTLDYTGVIKVDSAVTDMTGWTVRAQLRLADASRSFIDELACTWVDPIAAVLNIHASPESTEKYPVGTVLLDVRFTAPDGYVVSTQTAKLTVTESITHG